MREIDIFILNYLHKNGYKESYCQFKEDLSSKWLKDGVESADKMCQTESHLWVDQFDCEKSLQLVLKRRHRNKSVACQVTNVHCCQSKEENIFIERRMSSMQRTISYLREELRKRPGFEKPPPKIAYVRPQRFNPFKARSENPANK